MQYNEYEIVNHFSGKILCKLTIVM